MNEDYKGFTIYSANKDGGGTFWYMDGVVFPEKYKSLAAAKGAITKYLNKKAEFDWINALPVIEVVPRTQQEIDDYGPNGIQLVGFGARLFPLIVKGNKVTKSRNKREGGYCGRYKADNKNFKMAHYRVGPKGEFDTLKQTAKANRYFAAYGL